MAESASPSLPPPSPPAAVGDQRNAPRTPITLAVEYPRLNAFFADYTKNLSRGGTFIRTGRPLPIGTSFVFALHVPGLEEPLRIRGKVHWIVREEDLAPGGCLASETDVAPGMGIGFVYASEADRQRIARVVEVLMIESLGPELHRKLMRRLREG
ncbi:MAG: TIGR02266 family protein [Myxococcota bacterium]